MNSCIIIYVIAAVITAIIYDYSVAEKGIVWFTSIATLTIAIVCIIIVSFKLKKKDYNFRYNCWKMYKAFFPANASTYLFLIIILALSTILVLCVVFRAEPMQCDVHMECKSNGYIELNVDCDAEIDIQIVIDDEPVACVTETGLVNQSYGSEERYTLDAENYYTTSCDLTGEDWTSGYHTIAVTIEEKNEIDGIRKSKVYIENKFEVNSEGEFLFVRDVIETD